MKDILSHSHTTAGDDMTATSAHARRHAVTPAAATLVAALAIGCGTGAGTHATPTYGPPTAAHLYDA